MRKLTVLLAVGAALSLAGFAAADGPPATTTTQTTTTTSGPAAGPTTTTGPERRHPRWLAGSVSGVGASSLTVAVLWAGPNDGSLNGQTLTVSVPDTTRIGQGPDHRPIALAAIGDGDLVAVRASGDDPANLTAATIHVFCNCHWIGGTIGSVDGSAFTVDVTKTGPYDTVLDNSAVTLQADADTVYLHGPHQGRIGFGQLAAGMGVGVVFAANGFFRAPGFDAGTATLTARRVHVWGRGSVPPPASDTGAAAQVAP
jgi:hypothetical protein